MLHQAMEGYCMYCSSSCDRMHKLVPNAWKNSARPVPQTFALVNLCAMCNRVAKMFVQTGDMG